MNTKEWQDRLEKTFSGPSGIIGERLQEASAAERFLGAKYVLTLAGFPLLTESYLEFACETLQAIAAPGPHPRNLEDQFLVAAHLYAWRRARASYQLYLQTFHAESVSLLRGIWELTNSMIAVKKSVVSVGELFGGSPEATPMPDDPKERLREMKRVIQSAEGRVHTYVLGERSGISVEGREGLDGIREVFHQAVHRSTMNFAHYWVPWVLDKKPLALVQEYDLDVVSLNGNLTWIVLWPLVKSMAYLKPALEGASPSWDERHSILDDSFRHAMANFPKKSARAIEEFVKIHFE